MGGTQSCAQCGADLAEDAAWCGKCGFVRGAPVVAPIVPVAAPEVGAGRSTPSASSPTEKAGAWWRGLSRRGKLAAGSAVIVAILILAAIGGRAGTPSSSAIPTSAGPSSVAAVPGSASGTVAASPVATPPVSASEVASADASADVDDESSASAGTSFVPTATGLLPPSSSAEPADRLPGEPDPALTPGALNPAVTQGTIHSTICVSGWTATIRPDSSFTDALKVRQISQYGYSDTKTSSYEEDHLISLELGGAPADSRNLWPEPYTITLTDGRPAGAHTKDGFETRLKTEVCAGTITLAQAQSEIGDHWVHAYYGIALTGTPSSPASTTTSAAGAAAAGSPPAALAVTFLSLPNPAPLGGVAHLAVQTSPGASCVIVVKWPSGSKSEAGGLKTNPTAGADGIVSWDWNVASTTKPGTAKATVTCTLNGASAQGSAQFPVG